MVKSAFFVTAVFFLAGGLLLMGECHFLIPYRRFLLDQYGTPILVFAALLFLNVFAGVYVVCRKLFLNDMGRKLAHVEKQLRSAESISEELSRLLEE